VFSPDSDKAVLEKKLPELKAVLQKLPSVETVEESPQGPLPISTQLALTTTLLSEEKFRDLIDALKIENRSNRLSETLEQFTGGLEESELARLRLDPLQLSDFFETDNFLKQERPSLLKIISKNNLITFEAAQEFRNQIKQKLHQVVPYSKTFLTGRPAFLAEISQTMRRDMIVMLTFTLVLVSLAFLIFYRSMQPLGWILLLQSLALLCSFIAGRVIFGELNVLSLGFASILLGVGMDYCILVYHHFATGHSRFSSTWKVLRRGIWLSAITTAGAFGVLYASHFPGLQQLAVLVAIGLLTTAGFATEFLSVWLEKKRLKTPTWLMRVSERGAQILEQRQNGIRIGFCFILLLFGFGLFWLRHYPFYKSDLSQFQSTHLEAYRGQEILSSQSPELSSSISPTIILANIEKNRQRWIPITETTFFSTFEEQGLDRSWGELTWQVIEKLNQWHAGSDRLASLIRSTTAWPQLQSDLNRVAVEDFKRLSLAMLGILVALCIVAHRKLKLVFLNLFALITALVLLAIFLFIGQISMTLVSLLTIPLLIGLTIDYSLHILLALEEHRGSFKMTYLHLAVPVTLTGLSSFIGFSAPLLSSQPVLQNFGVVMDLGILAAVITGLILLPVFYKGVFRRKIT
jgi:predicted RND superfamily exporter protein